MSISERMRKRRDELGYTKKQVAEIIGVSESTILRWESGDIKNMGTDKVESLAKALKCSPAYLMGWEDIDAKYQLIDLYEQATDEEKREILAFAEFKTKKKSLT